MNKRLYPINGAVFNEAVLPVIEGNYIGKGRPPKVPHCKAFCGILYILRTGTPWRDLPEEYGHWHAVYDRFSRGGRRGLRAKVLPTLQERMGIGFEEVIIDSTTMKARRHGGGQKGAAGKREINGGDKREVPFSHNRTGSDSGRLSVRRGRSIHGSGLKIEEDGIHEVTMGGIFLVRNRRTH
jgi:transposase